MFTNFAPNTNTLSSTFAFHALRGAQQFGILEDMDIGEVIRRIRKDRGLTLEEVAGKIGADTGNLSRVERGLQNHTPEMIENLAGVFGVKVSTMYAIAEGSADVPPMFTPSEKQVLEMWGWLSDKQKDQFMVKLKENAEENRVLYEALSTKFEHTTHKANSNTEFLVGTPATKRRGKKKGDAP